MEVCRSPLEVESVHDPTELLPDVIGRLETPVVDKVVVTPLGILHVLLEGVVHVQKGQVITVDVRKPGNLKKNNSLFQSSHSCLSRFTHLNFESSAAFLASFGLTKHWGTDNIAVILRISLEQLFSQLAINILAS